MRMFEEELSWYEAEASCVSKGGHLVSVTSQKEQDNVKACAKAEQVVFFWLGATDSNTGGCLFTFDSYTKAWGVQDCQIKQSYMSQSDQLAVKRDGSSNFSQNALWPSLM